MESGGNRSQFEKFRNQQKQNSCSPEIVTGEGNDSLLQEVSTPNDGDIRDDQQQARDSRDNNAQAFSFSPPGERDGDHSQRAHQPTYTQQELLRVVAVVRPNDEGVCTQQREPRGEISGPTVKIDEFSSRSKKRRREKRKASCPTKGG